MLCGWGVNHYIFAALDVDGLLLVEDRVPGAVGRFVLGGGAGAAGVLNVEGLDFGAEVGKAPGDVGVVADDDEGDAGERDSGDVKIAGGGGGLEVGLVPDAGNAVGEVHVVGEERLAGGGVGAGDDPVVGASEAAFADGVAEGLLEGQEVFGEAVEWVGLRGTHVPKAGHAPALLRGFEELERSIRWIVGFEFGLGLVEGDVGDVFLWGGEVDDGLGGWVVTPGDDGVEVADEVLREAGGEGFAVELGGEAGGEVLEHDEADEEGVARCPGGGLVAEETELEREVGALEGHGGVYAGGILLEEVKLIGREGGDGAVGGGAELEGALEAVVGEERRAEDLGQGAGGMAAEGVHLPEAVLGGDEALGEEKIVERGGAEVGDAVGVALDGDGGGEAGDGDGAVELGKGVVHGLIDPVAGGDEGDDADDDDEGGKDDDNAKEDAAVLGVLRGLLGREGRVGNYVGVGEIGEIHRLIAV